MRACMTEFITQTRSPETEKQYTKKAISLIKRFNKENNPNRNPNDELFLNWLESIKKVYKPAAWRFYRASLAFYAEKKGKLELSAKIKKIEQISLSINEEPNDEKFHKSKTSSDKSKNISQKEQEQLQEYLISKLQKSFWAPRTLIYFRAGLITGLRPIEWEHAELINYFDIEKRKSVPTLKVKNAKNTNQRAHGEFRHLFLDLLSEKDLQIIKTQVINIKHLRGPNGKKTFEQYRKAISQCIYNARKDLWPKRKKNISIYTTRHQFAANLKAAGYSREEVAALMGHATDLTATKHYGKKRSGRKAGGLARANPEEVKRIRNTYKFEQINNNKRLKGPQ